MIYVSTFFFFNDTATTEIYTLSLHDALPICGIRLRGERRRQSPERNQHWYHGPSHVHAPDWCGRSVAPPAPDRKSTRLNSSHSQISYAVFCLKKKRILCTALAIRTSTTQERY